MDGSDEVPPGGAAPGAASLGWPAGLDVGAVVERLPEALLLVALTGPEGVEPIVTGSNAAARRLLRRARLELHGVPLRSLLPRGGGPGVTGLAGGGLGALARGLAGNGTGGSGTGSSGGTGSNGSGHSRGNGFGGDGTGANEAGTNGIGGNDTGANGFGANGFGGNGTGANGTGRSLPGTNGTGGNGTGANAASTNAAGTNAAGGHGTGRNAASTSGSGGRGTRASGAGGPGRDRPASSGLLAVGRAKAASVAGRAREGASRRGTPSEPEAAAPRPTSQDEVTAQARAWRSTTELLPGRLTIALPDGTDATVDGCALSTAGPGRLPLVLLHLRPAGGGPRDRVRALERRVGDLVSQVQRRLVAERRLRDLLARASDEAENARLSAEEYRLAFENAPVGTAVTDLDGRIHRANRALAGLLGRSVDDLSRLRLADLTHPDDVDKDARELAGLVQGRLPGYRVDKRYRRPDGSDVRVAVTVSLAHGADGSPGHLVVQVEDVDDQRAAEAALERLALHDALTGLPNRLLLRDRVRQALHRLGRGSSGCGLLFLDLDKFKFVNDAYGHDVGDSLLHEVGRRISSGLRASDTASRIGGDEFVVLCEDVPDLSGLTVVAERFERAVVRPVRIGDLTLSMTASIGLTWTADPATEADELLRQADLAMYRAKEGGRARSEAFDAALAAAARERTALERDLRHGIDQGDVVIHYQPIVDLRSGGLVRVEALVRWQHPSRGLLTPGAFIDLAEHTGLVVPLGEQVLRQACHTVAGWNERSGQELGLSVNVSPRQLSRTGFGDLVAETLTESGLSPGLLQLEITESVLAQTSPTSAQELAVVKRLGVGLGLDDFGTGFSSLEYLKAFPVDVIKIDRGFVGAVGSSREDAAIVRSVIELARALDLDCVAEGIETPEQAEVLLRLGSSHGQGYLFSRPVPFDTIADGSWSRATTA